MNGNPVTVTVNILKIHSATEKIIEKVTLQKSEIYLVGGNKKWIKFTFNTQFYGDSAIYPSTSLVDITNGTPIENNVSHIYSDTSYLAKKLGSIDFKFSISEQQRQTTKKRKTTPKPSSSSSSDLLFLGLLIVGVAVAGLGIGMSSV
jgi:hypothetical protein